MSRRQRGKLPPRDLAKATTVGPRTTREKREQLRAELAVDVERFLDAGGVIIKLPDAGAQAHRRAHGTTYNRKG